MQASTLSTQHEARRCRTGASGTSQGEHDAGHSDPPRRRARREESDFHRRPSVSCAGWLARPGGTPSPRQRTARSVDRIFGWRVARNAIARVTPDDVTYYVALPFDERLNGGWRRKGRAVLELMEAPPSEAESGRQAAGAEPSTTMPAARLPVSSQLCWIIGGRRSGRRRSGRLPERKRSSCARRSALAEAAHARGDRLRDQDGSDDLGHGHPEGGLSEPSAGSDGIMTNAARNSLTLVKGVRRRRP